MVCIDLIVRFVIFEARSDVQHLEKEGEMFCHASEEITAVGSVCAF